jgi:hypothetical protein
MSGKYPSNFRHRPSPERILGQIGAAIARTLRSLIGTERSLVPIPVRAAAPRRGYDQRRPRD